MLRMLVAALVGLNLAAQTQIDLATQAKRIDFTAANSTRPIKTGTALPATCTVGDMFFNTAAPAGANLYACTAMNIWSRTKSAAGQFHPRRLPTCNTLAGIIQPVSGSRKP